MVLSIKIRLRRLRRIHSWASDFLFWLDKVFAQFDPQHQPIFPRDNITEQSWKTLSFFLHTCQEGFAISTFPQAFDAVQTTPIECCGMIEANAHVLTYNLAHEVYMRLCEAIQPGCAKYGDIRPEIPECIDELTNEVWWPISNAARIEYPGCTPILWQTEIPRLNAILRQEYERAVNLLKQQSTIAKVDGKADNVNKVPVLVVGQNEKRDKWIYQEAIKGTTWDSIKRNLLEKHKPWERIESPQGIINAARRYANRHNLTLPPPRQSGRKTNQANN